MSTATIRGSVPTLQRAAKRRRAQALWGLMKRKPLGAAAASIILLIVFTAIFADVLAPYDPLFTHPEIRLAPPSWQHPFGTDDIGRDVCSRIIYGARISLWVGLLAVGIGTVARTIIRRLLGYFEGRGAARVQHFLHPLTSFTALSP